MPSPLDRLDELLAAASHTPWHYTGMRLYPGDREWPSVGADPYGPGFGAAVVMTTEPPYKGQDGKADAELVVWLVNHAAGLARIARAAEAMDAIRDEPLDDHSVYRVLVPLFADLHEALAGLGAASEGSE